MSNAVEAIADIDFDGKKWITLLRNRLCENGKLTEEDITDAFETILLKDSYNEKPDIVQGNSSKNSKSKLIYTLKENRNVNGLKDDQEIKFSPFFTLIYGLNGTGKTSYYKILKDAFHSDQVIRKNIFKENKGSPSANIDFVNKNEFTKNQKNGTIHDFPNSLETFEWSLHKRADRSIKFCDKSVLDNSLEEKKTGWSVDK